MEFDMINYDPEILSSIHDILDSIDAENKFEPLDQSLIATDCTTLDVVWQDPADNVQEKLMSTHDQTILDDLDPSTRHDQNEESSDGFMESCSLIDLLLKGAEAVEAENWAVTSTIVTKLNDLLSDQENGNNPLARLALYFTEGLIYRCLDSPELLEASISPQPNAFPAFQMLQELSPCVKFAHFTANQVILEAIQGHEEVHIVDFDVMEGIQWPSLMADLASGQGASMFLRITAVVSDQETMGNVQHTGARLQDFADSIRLGFMFDQILMKTEKDFEGIQGGDTVIANIILHQLHMPHKSASLVKTFLNGIKRLSPKLIVLTENELFSFQKASSTSFVAFFNEALQHYGAVSDSLMTGLSGDYKLAIKMVEKEFVRMRILESLKEFPCLQRERRLCGNKCPYFKGYKPSEMSYCNVTQAKFLVSLFNGNYWVQNEKCRLKLCWKSRPLITASVWVPTTHKSQCELSVKDTLS